MIKNDITIARLDLIAAKAKILSEQYKNNQMWDGDLERGLNDILSEINNIRTDTNRNDWQGDR